MEGEEESVNFKVHVSKTPNKLLTNHCSTLLHLVTNLGYFDTITVTITMSNHQYISNHLVAVGVRVVKVEEPDDEGGPLCLHGDGQKCGPWAA